MIRVLVAEDSLTTRRLLVEMLRSDPDVEVVGEAADGCEALEMTKLLQPAVVTMDVRMPRMDGFEATRRIMSEAPTPIVIVSANADVHEVEFSMHALRVGALTVLPKPAGPASVDFEAQRREFVQMIKAMADVKVVRRRKAEAAARPPKPPPPCRRGQAGLVAIAASTGGPPALARILQDLPLNFGLPVLVVQHIAAGFVDGLARWLNTAGTLPVKVAEDNEPLQPAMVYLAGDGRHLTVARPGIVKLVDTPAVDGFRPSATVLFQSVAQVAQDRAVAVVLTGMGHDGVEGLRAIRRTGGQVIAQDESTSVVFGMNGAAVAAGLTDVAVPLGALAAHVTQAATASQGGT